MVEHFGTGDRAGQHGDATAQIVQVPSDIPLHAIVERHGVRLAAARRGMFAMRGHPGQLVQMLAPVPRLLGHDFADQIASDQPGAGLGFGNQAFVVQVMGRQQALERASLANPPHQRAGIDSRDAHDAAGGQVVVQPAIRAEIAGHAAEVANHEAGQVGTAALDVFDIDPVVADFRIRHGDDLTAIAGVGQNLLIPGHRGIEANLAVDFSRGSKCGAAEHGAVFKGQFRNAHSCSRSSVRVPIG